LAVIRIFTRYLETRWWSFILHFTWIFCIFRAIILSLVLSISLSLWFGRLLNTFLWFQTAKFPFWTNFNWHSFPFLLGHRLDLSYLIPYLILEILRIQHFQLYPLSGKVGLDPSRKNFFSFSFKDIFFGKPLVGFGGFPIGFTHGLAKLGPCLPFITESGIKPPGGYKGDFNWLFSSFNFASMFTFFSGGPIFFGA